MKKRIVSLLLSVCLVATMLVGCGGGSASTDTEQKTESSGSEQGTEFSTEQSTEQEKVVKMPYSIYIRTEYADRKDTSVDNIFYQYVTGSSKEGNYYQAFTDFMKSENASDGAKEFETMLRNYNGIVPEYKNGSLIVEKVAHSISYDGEIYSLIYHDDEYEVNKTNKFAILYKITLDPSGDRLENIVVNVIVTFTQGENTSFAVLDLDGLYSTDYMSKYFPDLNLE